MQTEGQTPSRRELRNFGLLFGAMLALMFGLVLPWIFAFPMQRWPWIAGLAVASTGLLLPRGLYPLHRVWMKFAMTMGWFNTHVILFVVFVCLLTPLGFLLRNMHRLQFDKAPDSNRKTYRVMCSKRPATDLEHPF